MYFSKFPKILYDIKQDNNFKVVTDIFRRIKVREKIKDNISLLDKYDVGEVKHLKQKHLKYMATQTIFGLYV